MASSAPQEANAFHVLRIAAACSVIFSHHFHLTATPAPPWLHSDMVGGVAVMTFFSISGFLVTLSWQRDPRLVAYTGKRLLRLWPGMLVAVMAGMFVFGPWFTKLRLSEFLVHPETAAHWRNLLLFQAHVTLPGVFPKNPYPGVMNGPLWTIPMEATCYVVLGLAGAAGVLRWRWLATLLLLCYVVFFLTQRNADLSGPMQHWFEYPAYFAVGGLIALYQRSFMANAAVVMLVVLPLAAVLFFGAGFEHSAGLVLLPPLLIYMGTRRAAVFSHVQRAGDPSYGIYVLGYPIQQAVQATFPHWAFWPSLLLSLGLAIMLGYASWHVVEAPALRLKRLLTPSTRSRGQQADELPQGLQK